MAYTIYVDGKPQKTYPYKAQAVVWCYMHGFVTRSLRHIFLDNRVEIKEEAK